MAANGLVEPSGLLPQTSALTRLRHTPSKGQSTRRSAELLVEPVDHVRQALELLGDDAHPELEEVLRLHAERLRERLDDVVRGHGPVPVDDVVEVAGREL